jgi:hypothetical protein
VQARGTLTPRDLLVEEMAYRAAAAAAAAAAEPAAAEEAAATEAEAAVPAEPSSSTPVLSRPELTVIKARARARAPAAAAALARIWSGACWHLSRVRGAQNLAICLFNMLSTGQWEEKYMLRRVLPVLVGTTPVDTIPGVHFVMDTRITELAGKIKSAPPESRDAVAAEYLAQLLSVPPTLTALTAVEVRRRRRRCCRRRCRRTHARTALRSLRRRFPLPTSLAARSATWCACTRSSAPT